MSSSNSYEAIFKNFHSNLSTLKVFVSGVEASLLSQERESIKKNVNKLIPAMLAYHEAEPAIYQMPSELYESVKKSYSDQVQVVYKDEEDKSQGYSLNILGRTGQEVEEAFEEIVFHRGQINMLYQSSLISLIVFFELSISRVLHTHITKFPGIMSIKEKTLSLEEIRRLGTFEDAEKHLIDQEIENIMFGSLEKWYKYLTEKIKIGVPYFEKNKDRLIEIFQRRNIVVHNDGIANSIYFKNVISELRDSIKLGDKIIIDRDYINSSILLIEISGTFILIEMWRKAEKVSPERVEMLLDDIYDAMMEENWELSAAMSSAVLIEKEINAQQRLVAQINYWLSMKRKGEFKSIQKDIENADFGAYNRRFQLAIFALNDETESFFELLESAIPHDIDLNSVKEWPLFSEMREQPAYTEFISRHEDELVVEIDGEEDRSNEYFEAVKETTLEFVEQKLERKNSYKFKRKKFSKKRKNKIRRFHFLRNK